jgi:hypothetical protein
MVLQDGVAPNDLVAKETLRNDLKAEEQASEKSGEKNAG